MVLEGSCSVIGASFAFPLSRRASFVVTACV